MKADDFQGSCKEKKRCEKKSIITRGKEYVTRSRCTKFRTKLRVPVCLDFAFYEIIRYGLPPWVGFRVVPGKRAINYLKFELALQPVCKLARQRVFPEQEGMTRT